MTGPLRPQARHTLLVAVATALHLNQSPLTYSLPEAFIAAFSTILIRDCFNAGLLFTALDLAASIHTLTHSRMVGGGGARGARGGGGAAGGRPGADRGSGGAPGD